MWAPLGGAARALVMQFAGLLNHVAAAVHAASSVSRSAAPRSIASRWSEFFQQFYTSPLYLIVGPVEAAISIVNPFSLLWFSVWQLLLWLMAFGLLFAPPSSANGVPAEDGAYVKHFTKCLLRALLCVYLLSLAVTMLSNVAYNVVVDDGASLRRLRSRLGVSA